MGAAEKLKARFGANMRESLGVRSHQEAKTQGAPPQASPDSGRTRDRDTGIMEIARIVPDPNQPRKAFEEEEIASLAASILARGQLLPVRVRWSPTLGKWVLLSGERRYRAALLAGVPTMHCILVDRPLDDAEILEEQLIENGLRADLKPIEQAQGFQRLMGLKGWEQRELALALHLSQGTVSRALALLSLPEEVQQQVDSRELAATVAYEVAVKAKKGKLNQEEVVKEARSRRAPAMGKPRGARCTFTAGEAEVQVRFGRPAGEAEVVAALEDALDQARAKLPPLRIAA